MSRNIKNIVFSFILIILSIALSTKAGATHNRAGEITLIQLSELTFQINITTFTYTKSLADRDFLDVQWGDNTISTAERESLTVLPNFYQRNVYISQHTFPGPGTYEVVVQDPNRNDGVKNIPNSVFVIFSIKTIITINPDLGFNSTPVLLNYPIDKAALHQTFIHNPAAFDFDGDSISYKLTVCTKENGKEITDYQFPEASDTLYVNPVTGDLVWDAPVDTGIYNIAMNIEEWRKGVKIGNIARDMQVEVYNTLNNPPINENIENFCILAGTRFQLPIHSTDEDNDELSQLITGGPFAYNDTLTKLEETFRTPGELTTLFTWDTECKHARSQAFSVIVKTEDHNKEISLVDIDNFSIKVLGPPPATPKIIPSSSSINLFWDPYICNNIIGYNIYRKQGSSDYTYDACSPGLPASSGFEWITSTNSYSDTSLLDNNNGNGLLQGIEYCYRITAILTDGSESFPSEEICSNLISGSPSLLQVSVIDSDENGSIKLSWAKPLSLDTIPANGPYEYIIYQSNDIWGSNLIPIDSYTPTSLDDTTYLISDIDTKKFPYSYSVELYNNESGKRFLIGKAETASSLYPEINEMDNELRLNIRRNVPWLNTEYTIFRYNNSEAKFDSIGTTNSEIFIDKNLKNNVEYCYYVKSYGKRDLNNKEYFNTNISHQNCGTPKDTISPCPPILKVQSDCDSLFNLLNWHYLSFQEECSVDVVKYKIYYTSHLDTKHIVIDSIIGKNKNQYIHDLKNAEGLAASYYITAIDSFGNESLPSLTIVVDDCIKYSIPNVFSPNGDNINDILNPYEYQDVEKIDMKIFNRWGQLIFETEDPDINWNGKQMKNNKLVSPGVYYYICDVYEKRIIGISIRNIVGFIHVYHEKGANNTDEVEIY